MKRAIEIVPGAVFGRLTAMREGERVLLSGKRRRTVICVCQCGTQTTVPLVRLRSGKTKSCGCLSGDVTAARNRTHGLSHSSEYHIWAGMLSRCNNKKSTIYKHYGGRGIAVCGRWDPSKGGSFENFYSDMGPRPGSSEIERVDNDGPYSPSNCCWATRAEQMRNRRNTRTLTLDGVTKSAPEWAEITGIPVKLITARVVSFGWSDERALTTPAGRMARPRTPEEIIAIKNDTRPQDQIAAEFGITQSAVSRIKRRSLEETGGKE